MDPLQNYGACLDIETARCDLRKGCQQAQPPDPDFSSEFKGFEHDTCIAYAEEHCRTREIGGGEDGIWNDGDVEACVRAIKTLVTCGQLRKGTDETHALDGCEFIDPAEETPITDAGTDAS